MGIHVTTSPANTANYRAGRDGRDVDLVVLHTIEGSAPSALSWFGSPMSHVSAHYVVGKDGAIWQAVGEGACAWHAGNADYNLRSIGIECEGYHDLPETWTPRLTESLVQLLADICRRHPAVTPDRQHIIGHAEVPDPYRPGCYGGAGGHTDPGVLIPWDFIVGELQRRLAPPLATTPAAPEGDPA